MTRAKKTEFDSRVHLYHSIRGFGIITTACGARMQVTDKNSELSNDVNYWGKIGIRVERPFTTVTLDPSKVTCKRKGCKS